MTRVADRDDPLRVVSASLPVRTVASGPLEDYSPARHAAWETSREALAEVMRDTEAALYRLRIRGVARARPASSARVAAYSGAARRGQHAA
ncbi:hypothetical protein G6F54_014262 [Rhizopus delemar]|nr:hypothetical protein G6F54_014262 [Rhizopus delemar]